MKILNQLSFLFTIILSLGTFSALAQSDYRRGYIITQQNDTTWGYIQNLPIPSK
jgi:hypothetical protein